MRERTSEQHPAFIPDDGVSVVTESVPLLLAASMKSQSRYLTVAVKPLSGRHLSNFLTIGIAGLALIAGICPQ